MKNYAVLIEYMSSTTCTWELDMTKNEATARAEALARRYGSHARVSVVPELGSYLDLSGLVFRACGVTK